MLGKRIGVCGECLLINGARRVGKTFSIREFWRECYQSVVDEGYDDCCGYYGNKESGSGKADGPYMLMGGVVNERKAKTLDFFVFALHTILVTFAS